MKIDKNVSKQIDMKKSFIKIRSHVNQLNSFIYVIILQKTIYFSMIFFTVIDKGFIKVFIAAVYEFPFIFIENCKFMLAGSSKGIPF